VKIYRFTIQFYDSEDPVPDRIPDCKKWPYIPPDPDTTGYLIHPYCL